MTHQSTNRSLFLPVMRDSLSNMIAALLCECRWPESDGDLLLVEAQHGLKQLITDPVLVSTAVQYGALVLLEWFRHH